MFTTLVESNAARERRRGGTALSIVAHTAVITLAMYATAQARPASRPEKTDVVFHVVPAPTKHQKPPAKPLSGPPPMKRIFVPPISVDSTLPPVHPVAAPIDTTFWERRAAGQTPSEDPAETPTAPDQVFLAPQVDKPAAVGPGSAQPTYPDMLRTAGIEGAVIGQFVVDTVGRVEPGSFKVVQSDNDLFIDAVKAVLPRLRFYPAQAGGRRVRQMVEQQFTFQLR